MTAQLRQETAAFVRQTRRYALTFLVALALSAGWLAIADTPLMRGFGVTALGASVLLSAAGLLHWWRGTRFAADVTAALETGRPIDGLRGRIARSIGWLRRAQNAGLVLGTTVVIAAARNDGEYAAGAAFGIVTLLVAEQVLDHAAEQRAERFQKLLGSAR